MPSIRVLERRIGKTFERLEKILNQEQLASLCRERQRALGMTAADIATSSKLHVQTVLRFMRTCEPYTRFPRLSTTMAIAKALGWNVWIGK